MLNMQMIETLPLTKFHSLISTVELRMRKDGSSLYTLSDLDSIQMSKDASKEFSLNKLFQLANSNVKEMTVICKIQETHLFQIEECWLVLMEDPMFLRLLLLNSIRDSYKSLLVKML